MELFKSRPRVVYTNAVGDKVYPVVVDIKKGIKSTEDIQFVSSDVNTGILSVAFIQGNDNYNVTGADVVCSVMRPDASTLELPCEVVRENIVEVPLGINGTSQDGLYSFDFKVFKGENKVVGTPIMNYSVSLSIGNDMAVEEDDRLPVLTMLMTQLTELKGEARESINQANTATVASREATAKAIEATANANAVSERVSQETSEVISRVDNKVNEVETRFNALTTSQQQSSEVIDARDGETSLKARLDRDLYKDGISLSDRIEAIEGLKDSQNMKYATDKGYLVCQETKNGVIDDLKIEGKTLVNRTDIFNKVNPTGGGAHRKTSNSLIVDYSKCGELDNSYSLDEINVFKSGQIYTIIIDIIQNTLNQKVEFYPMIWDFATIISGNQFVNTGEVGRKIFVIKSNKDYALKLAYASPGQATQGVTGLVEFKDIMVLDGDYTNIELPNYFEGLMSVGEDVDKIEVLSRKEDGNLLFFNNDFSYTSNGITYTVDAKTQVITVNGTCTLDNTTCTVVDALPKQIYNGVYSCTVEKLTDFSSPIIVRTYNKDYSNGVVLNIQNSLSGTVKKPYVNDVIVFSLRVDNGATFNNAKFKVSFYKGDIKEEYTPHQSDKKQILFYNENGELEPVQELHEWDSIEKHSDNKWYYHKRSGKVVLNGNEDWLLKQVNTNCTVFALRETQLQNKIKLSPQGVSDKFAWESVLGLSTEVECIGGHSVDVNTIRIAVAKSKLSTQDVQGFKQWLQANNVTVVYQLAEEEVYELAPLHLDSYANETLILCNSGAISPKMEFSITSHINNLVLSNTKRINALEEKVFSALKQVLAGDMYSLAELLYPEDFVEENPENEIMLLPFE